MEFIGHVMSDDFEEFLSDRRCEASVCKEKCIDLETVLQEKGLSSDDAYAIQSDVLGVMGDNLDAAYSKGVKDGAKLMLHLLGMAPENRKEASQ
jgi:hypothetical protein